MLPLLRNSALALIVAAVPLVAQNAPAKSAHAVQRRAKATAKHHRSGKQPAAPTAKHQRSGKQPAAPAASAPQPITQMTPEQLPASPPQVTYQNGLLAIDSRNSTLQDILAAVRRQTGAQIDIPPGAPAERVAAHLGPAAPRDVLSSLLVGSRFGYIILGAPDRPDAVQKVVLTLLPAGGSAAAQAPAAAAMNRPQTPPPQVESSPDEEEPDVVERNAMPPDQPAPPSMEAPAQPGVVQPGQPNPYTGGEQPRFFPGGQAPPQVAPNQQQPGSPQTAPTQPQVKTPDQLLQELQRLRNQQQQIQQQQQQNQQPPPQ